MEALSEQEEAVLRRRVLLYVTELLTYPSRELPSLSDETLRRMFDGWFALDTYVRSSLLPEHSKRVDGRFSFEQESNK